ncbi:MAG: hypothetical protein OXU61_05845 [Gammaproteobacteria bacterium]|nr:hypothetical protein [Gammaproteobacteria bacterium]
MTVLVFDIDHILVFGLVFGGYFSAFASRGQSGRRPGQAVAPGDEGCEPTAPILSAGTRVRPRVFKARHT